MNSIASRLKFALEIRGEKAKPLAEKIGITRQTISNLLRGESKTFSAEVALKLSRSLQIDPYWLIFGEGEEPKAIKSTERTPKEEADQILNTLPLREQKLAVKVLKQLQEPL